MLAALTTVVEQQAPPQPQRPDMSELLQFLFEVLQHPSLVVSIPVLHAWTRLLRVQSILDTPPTTQLVPGLLETCSRRLIRYEHLPDDADEPALAFLLEDLDTLPERHAFLGNYRRYCTEVVQTIVRMMPRQALTHILTQASTLFDAIAAGQADFRGELGLF